MARVIHQSGPCWNHVSVIEEHVDDVPIAGPRLSGHHHLVHLPHGPHDPHSSVADWHVINWNPRSCL